MRAFALDNHVVGLLLAARNGVFVRGQRNSFLLHVVRLRAGLVAVSFDQVGLLDETGALGHHSGSVLVLDRDPVRYGFFGVGFDEVKFVARGRLAQIRSLLVPGDHLLGGDGQQLSIPSAHRPVIATTPRAEQLDCVG